MLTLHTWTTQNARKISVMLEECALSYDIVLVDILHNEQFSPPQPQQQNSGARR